MKKVLKALWKTSITALSITALLSSTVFAKATKIDVKGQDGKFYDYNLAALKASAVAAAINGSADPGAKLYNYFLENKAAVKGFYDDVRGAYVDYATVAKAAADTAINGQTFILDRYLEDPTTATIALTPSNVTANADGTVVAALPASMPVTQTPSHSSDRSSVPYIQVNASAVNLTTIKVTFNANVTNRIAGKDNYTLSKGTVVSAEKTGDSEVTLTVSGLTYQDTTNLNVVSPAYSINVKMPSVSDLYSLVINSDNGNTVIKGDGVSQIMLIANIVDKVNKNIVMKDAQIQFTAAVGSLSQEQVTTGEASVILTSTSSAASVASAVTATVTSCPGAPEYVGLSAQKNIYFYPADYDVSVVSDITIDTVKVQMTTAPAIKLEDTDAAKFIVLNGKGSPVSNPVKKVENDISNPKIYTLTLTNSLDGTEGNLSVNGKEPAAKAYTQCDWDYDFKKPELKSVSYNKTTGTLVLAFSEPVSLQDMDGAKISLGGFLLPKDSYTKGSEKSTEITINIHQEIKNLIINRLTGDFNVEIKEGAFKDGAENLSEAGLVKAEIVNN